MVRFFSSRIIIIYKENRRINILYKYHCNYCNKDFEFQKSQQVGSHVRNCKMNPKQKQIIEKISKSLKYKRKEYSFNCKRCGKQYKLLLTQNQFKAGKYKKHCSRNCANVRNHSQQTKSKISKSLTKPKFVPKVLIKQCNYCHNYFIFEMKSKNQKGKFCSNSCKSKYYSSTPFSNTKKVLKINENIVLNEDYKAYIYKTTNMINGKFYIGMHTSNDIQNDNYLGSGIALNRAIKKYGRQNFKRQILKQFDNYQEAFQYQKKIVNQNLVKDEDCYNLTIGGYGGPHFKSKHHSNNTKNKISESLKNK